jgi:hypothetical protein
MVIEKNMKVLIESQNDLLKAYQKAKMPFFVDSVVKDDVGEEYVTLRFEDGDKLGAVVMGYEIRPYVII